ncbi:RNA-directed DNA polymerase, eukaryota, reverse transcriptase zinc-binding domain protein [Tanacetum coccineum]
MDTDRRSSKRQQKIPNHFNDFINDLNKWKESVKSKGNNGKNKNGKDCLDQANEECLDKNVSQNGLFKELTECKDSDTEVLKESGERDGMMLRDAELGDEAIKGVNVPTDKVKFGSVNDEMLTNNAGCCDLKLPTEQATRMVGDESQTHTRTNNIMDQITSNMCRMGTGRVGFARVLVEVEAGKGLPDTIKIEYKNCEKVVTGKKYVKVEYNWAPTLCSFCKVFGHNDKKCSSRPKTDEELEEIKKAKAQKSEVEDDFVQVNHRKKNANIPKMISRNEGNTMGTKKNHVMYKPVKKDKAPNGGRCNVNRNIIDSIRKSANKYSVLTDLTEEGGTLEYQNLADMEEINCMGTVIMLNSLMDMKIDAWNIRGLGKLSKQNVVHNLKNDEKLSVCVMLETRLKGHSVNIIGEKVFKGWNKYDNAQLFDRGCRIMIGWDSDKVQCMILHASYQSILCLVESVKTSERIFCVFIYAENNGKLRRKLWADLVAYKAIYIEELQDCVNSIKMADLSSTGLHYTWTKSLLNPNASVLNKINRVIGIEDFMEVYSRAHDVFLPYGISDHSPAVLTCSNAGKKNTRSLRFANYIADKMKFGSLVSENWNVNIDGFAMFKLNLDEVQSKIDRDPQNRVLKEIGVNVLREYPVALNDVYDVVKEFFAKEKLLGELNATLITLVPKQNGQVDYVMCFHPSYSLCINGERHAFFKGGRGLSLEITHLCFADDLLVMCHGDVNSIKVIKSALDTFSNVSGLHPNLSKSTIFCGSMDKVTIDSILNILPFKKGKLAIKYLGVPLVAKKIRVKNYKSLIDKAGLPTLDSFISRKEIYTASFSNDDTITDCVSDSNWKWPIDWFTKFLTLHMYKVPILNNVVEDKLMWKTNNRLTMKFASGRVWKDMRCLNRKVQWWRVVWFPQNIPRHAFVLWLAVKGKLVTQDKLSLWYLDKDWKCPLCKKIEDSHRHLFFDCDYSKDIWSKIQKLAKVNKLLDVLDVHWSLNFSRTHSWIYICKEFQCCQRGGDILEYTVDEKKCKINCITHLVLASGGIRCGNVVEEMVLVQYKVKWFAGSRSSLTVLKEGVGMSTLSLNDRVDEEMISLYSLHLGEPGLINYVIKPSRWFDFSTKASELNIKLEEGAVIDVKLSSYKIWILKENGLVLHNLAGTQESVIFEELFQSSEHATDDLFLLAHSPYPSAERKEYGGGGGSPHPTWLHHRPRHHTTTARHSQKSNSGDLSDVDDFDDLEMIMQQVQSEQQQEEEAEREQVATHVSSIFLRLLFLPGIFYHSVIRATLQDHNVHLTNSEFHSFTADGMKKEIISVIESEAASRSPLSHLYCWKNFCSHYIDHWCRENAPCGLILDSSTGAVVLIIKSSVSLFRYLEEIEISCVFTILEHLVKLARFSFSNGTSTKVNAKVNSATTQAQNRVM